MYKIETMSAEERDRVREYYPVQEILANRDNKAAFRIIDVWMLGQSFRRIAKAFNYDCPSNKEMKNIIKLADDMTAPSWCRSTIQQVD